MHRVRGKQASQSSNYNNLFTRKFCLLRTRLLFKNILGDKSLKRSNLCFTSLKCIYFANLNSQGFRMKFQQPRTLS